MLVRIDARRFTDQRSLHATLSEILGFPKTCGENWDALIDCLSDLDQPFGTMTRIHVLPGQTLTLVLEHVDAKGDVSAPQIRMLIDAVAFVNWRRIEQGQPAVLALAYDAPLTS
jgi:RNAse (barnase) inhibitor barstar